MPLDAYHTLGVPLSATPEEIRRAYKRQARIHHPDKNLDDPYATTRFQLLQQAYEILSDPDQRSRYDAGEPPKKPDPRPAAIGMVCEVFFEVLQAHGDRGIIGHMRRRIDARGRDTKAKLRDGKTAIARLRNAKEQFSYKGQEPNYLAIALDDQIQKVSEQLGKLQLGVDIAQLAGQILADYDDVRDLEVAMFASASSSTSSTSSGTTF